MKTLSKMMIATVALSALPATTAFLPANAPTQSSQSASSLDARRRLSKYDPGESAVDKLIAKREALKKQVAAPSQSQSPRKNCHAESKPMLVGDGLEYLYDVKDDRDIDDPFHIILLGSTFAKNPDMSTYYINESFSRILGLSHEKAFETTSFARRQGFSCLGTWTRDQCLSIGKELQAQGFECRVVPVSLSEGKQDDCEDISDWGSEALAHC